MRRRVIPIERNTIQRTLILEAVNRLHTHPTAEEVYSLVASEHPNIGRATVYRNLKQLAAAGKISEVETLGGDAEHFDYQNHKHYHVRCLNCGKIFDVEMEYIPDMEKSIKDTHGFQITGHTLLFKGICKKCQSENAHTEG